MLSVHKNRQRLEDAFAEFISGRGATRSRLELVLGGQAVDALFREALEENGFAATTVGAVNVRVGERVPAFYIEDSVAYFGWIFWEKFTETKARKLWGSVIRNSKGDWAIQIPPTKNVPIYANPALKIDMEVDQIA